MRDREESILKLEMGKRERVMYFERAEIETMPKARLALLRSTVRLLTLVYLVD